MGGGGFAKCIYHQMLKKSGTLLQQQTSHTRQQRLPELKKSVLLLSIMEACPPLGHPPPHIPPTYPCRCTYVLVARTVASNTDFDPDCWGWRSNQAAVDVVCYVCRGLVSLQVIVVPGGSQSSSRCKFTSIPEENSQLAPGHEDEQNQRPLHRFTAFKPSPRRQGVQVPMCVADARSLLASNRGWQGCVRNEGGVWNPKVCGPTMAQINISFCKFHFFPL